MYFYNTKSNFNAFFFVKVSLNFHTIKIQEIKFSTKNVHDYF